MRHVLRLWVFAVVILPTGAGAQPCPEGASDDWAWGLNATYANSFGLMGYAASSFGAETGPLFCVAPGHAVGGVAVFNLTVFDHGQTTDTPSGGLFLGLKARHRWQLSEPLVLRSQVGLLWSDDRVFTADSHFGVENIAVGLRYDYLVGPIARSSGDTVYLSLQAGGPVGAAYGTLTFIALTALMFASIGEN